MEPFDALESFLDACGPTEPLAPSRLDWLGGLIEAFEQTYDADLDTDPDATHTALAGVRELYRRLRLAYRAATSLQD